MIYEENEKGANKILLFVKDFQLGTKISEAITDLDLPVTFAEGEGLGMDQVNDNTDVAIVDLDDKAFQTIAFISGLRNISTHMKIVGYMDVVHKDTYDRLKSAGCDIILPKSSFVKNIATIIS